MILHFVVLSLSFGTAELSSLTGQGQAQAHEHALARTYARALTHTIDWDLYFFPFGQTRRSNSRAAGSLRWLMEIRFLSGMTAPLLSCDHNEIQHVK